MSTDSAWEEWGRRDPYFGVITDPKFRRGNITDDTKREFFESGAWHVNYVMKVVHQHIDVNFRPKRVLEFGCGVGRLLVPFASIAEEVVGLDVSPSMLQEAKRNCEESRATNVKLLLSDDTLSSLSGDFDLIHSCIVFQHIPIERGRLIFSQLLQHLNPGGVGAVQLTYSKARYAATHGIEPVALATALVPQSHEATGVDPVIQMNPYNMNSILFLMQENRVARFYADFTDHGGELGIFLFFQRP
jgi:2-polyprenyl-3-methyl-5-hydroxy-6-metoxy-1,4-benzoquinol methylase